MARVTVEDCIEKVENRFDLVLLASHRSRMISSGAPLTIDRDNDKNPVVALREIAEETVSANDLREDLIHSMQKYVDVDEPEAEAAPPTAAIEHENQDKAAMAPESDSAGVSSMERMSEEDLLRGLESLAANGKSG